MDAWFSLGVSVFLLHYFSLAGVCVFVWLGTDLSSSWQMPSSAQLGPSQPQEGSRGPKIIPPSWPPQGIFFFFSDFAFSGTDCNMQTFINTQTHPDELRRFAHMKPGCSVLSQPPHPHPPTTFPGFLITDVCLRLLIEHKEAKRLISDQLLALRLTKLTQIALHSSELEELLFPFLNVEFFKYFPCNRFCKHYFVVTQINIYEVEMFISF